MLTERLFQFALTASIILHGVILSQVPGLNLQRENRKQDKLEVVYVKDTPAAKTARGGALRMGSKATSSKREPLLRLSSKVTMGKSSPPPP